MPAGSALSEFDKHWGLCEGWSNLFRWCTSLPWSLRIPNHIPHLYSPSSQIRSEFRFLRPPGHYEELDFFSDLTRFLHYTEF